MKRRFLSLVCIALLLLLLFCKDIEKKENTYKDFIWEKHYISYDNCRKFTYNLKSHLAQSANKKYLNEIDRKHYNKGLMNQ